VLELVAGAAIILGKYFKEATVTLAVFVFIITFIFHGPNSWAENMMQQMSFMKNMAIVGGLLFMAAHGAGNTWRLKM
jgi:putative oxidoreductase